MTLHVFDDLEQGSDEWLAARRGIVTASVVGQLITPGTIKAASNPHSRSLTALLTAERITGWSVDGYYGGHMERGHQDEPAAVDTYSEHFAPVTPCGFMVREFDYFRLGYSPDGLVGDDGLIEIKSREPKKHLATIVANEVPAENVAQCQAALLVSGREWLDYLSFCGGMPLYPIRVYPDPKWRDAIISAATKFEHAVVEMTNTYEARTAGLPMTERTPDFEEITF